ncbi:ribonuclease domain-containing protein [Saccharopolyspora phatthalungensis]|uniref:Guanyl-specific ribonuclease Sa n=1 Tax=Saccharopolyspora phatthalungensis TaxID=664693 RepID=A0A840Q0E5_9PSEU|nr:ribonuclease domain-containing protein [Saccharopolyspora phatthalungensis]MBB5152981.1 guanyl-specific ribonuclease Sa [Saccharopolyspora phatthalungensis]
MTSRRRISAALVGLIALVVIGWFVRDYAGAGTQQAVPGAESGLPVQELSALPPEAGQTWRLIIKGGPFPFPGKDGSVFGNREHILPGQAAGYYHEYTVPTPGSPDRGARRLVTGGHSELYYTSDHYESFVVVNAAG